MLGVDSQRPMVRQRGRPAVRSHALVLPRALLGDHCGRVRARICACAEVLARAGVGSEVAEDRGQEAGLEERRSRSTVRLTLG
ncbi:hypothetical protein GCM10010193_66830 [Kitasatospora atroaurantiaca]